MPTARGGDGVFSVYLVELWFCPAENTDTHRSSAFFRQLCRSFHRVFTDESINHRGGLPQPLLLFTWSLMHANKKKKSSLFALCLSYTPPALRTFPRYPAHCHLKTPVDMDQRF